MIIIAAFEVKRSRAGFRQGLNDALIDIRLVETSNKPAKLAERVVAPVDGVAEPGVSAKLATDGR